MGYPNATLRHNLYQSKENQRMCYSKCCSIYRHRHCHYAFAITWICLTLCSNISLSAVDARLSDDSKAKFDIQAAAISRESKSLPDSHWAGTYIRRSVLAGINGYLALAPKNGFVFQSNGLHNVTDRNYGHIRQEQDAIILSFAFKNRREPFKGLCEKLYPVTWGKRKYIIEEDDLLNFCNSVNSGHERGSIFFSRFFMQYCRRAGKINPKTGKFVGIPVTGLPEIPEAYRPYLLSKPIEAEIVRVNKAVRSDLGPMQSIETAVTLNVGKMQAVLPGMEFYPSNDMNHLVSSVVTTATDTSCQVIMRCLADIKQNDARLPKIGWKMSTAR